MHLASHLPCCFLLTFLFLFCFFPCLYPGESSHLALNKLKCPHCNYIAKHRRTLKRHLIIHSGVRSFSCDICGKLFTRREHVKRHSLVSSHMYTYIILSPFLIAPCGALLPIGCWTLQRFGHLCPPPHGLCLAERKFSKKSACNIYLLMSGGCQKVVQNISDCETSSLCLCFRYCPVKY